MRFKFDGYEKVSRRGAASTGLAFSRDTHEFSVRNTGRYVDAYRFLFSVGTTKSHGAGCAAVRVLERDPDLSFQVAPPSRKSRAGPAGGASPRAAKDRFKEVAELAEISKIN